MTVWIVNPFDNLPTEGFRPQRYWLMAAAFARAGHRVVYWTADFNHGTKGRRRKAGAGAPPTDFEVVEIPTRPYARNVCLARIASHRRLARDFETLAHARLPAPGARSASVPDLVIASTPPLGLCDAARCLAGRWGAKFVCDIQDAWPETFARLLPRGFRWLGEVLFAPLRRTARRIYRGADLVTGVCARYRGLSGRSDFHLAYLGIADAAPGPAPGVSDRAEACRLVYVGNLGAGYDLKTVIGAVARRANLTFDVAGRGPREAALRAVVAGGRLGDRVRFHGYLGAEAMRELLGRCDVGVIPLRDDSWVGLPNKLCDYLAAGLPVLSSLGGECGDLLIRTGSGRMYESGDPDSLLRALDTLSPAPVSLPPELRAEDIYPRYVRRCLDVVAAGG